MNSEEINVCSDDGTCFQMSRYLQRYHSIDENLNNSLKESYLWFSDPTSFNDVYDCNLVLNTSDATIGEIYDYLREGFSKNNRGKPVTFLEDRAIHLFNNPSEMRECEIASNKKSVDKIGICCFSERDDSLLMWSHYANKHKGVCLTFDVGKDENIFEKRLYKVEYCTTYPEYKWPRDRGTFKPLRLLITTKSKDWDYENEIRVVRSFNKEKDNFRGKVGFNKRALSAIKFGYKSDESECIKIKSILEKAGGYEHVKFYKAKLKIFEFGMEYEEIFI